MANKLQPIKELQEYVKKTKDTDYGLKNKGEDDNYATRLVKTLQALQNQVKQHEAALEQVKYGQLE